jgi:hypothetical protein
MGGRRRRGGRRGSNVLQKTAKTKGMKKTPKSVKDKIKNLGMAK